MNFQKILVPVGAIAALVVAYNMFGGPGLALVGGGMVMFLLLHFNRLMQVFRRASERPVGFTDSAVMLNAKLRPGVNLLHVIAMTRSLGAQQSPPGVQPELFRWTDAGGSHVTCEFQGGKLVKWEMWRPAAEAPAPQDAPPAA